MRDLENTFQKGQAEDLHKILYAVQLSGEKKKQTKRPGEKKKKKRKKRTRLRISAEIISEHISKSI